MRHDATRAIKAAGLSQRSDGDGRAGGPAFPELLETPFLTGWVPRTLCLQDAMLNGRYFTSIRL